MASRRLEHAEGHPFNERFHLHAIVGHVRGFEVIIEQWSDVAALEAHLKAPHMADYRVKVKPFVKGVTLRVLQPA